MLPQVDLAIVATSVLLLAMDTVQLEAVKVGRAPSAAGRDCLPPCSRAWLMPCMAGAVLVPTMPPALTAHPHACLQALRVLRAAKPLRALTRSAGMRLVFR